MCCDVVCAGADEVDEFKIRRRFGGWREDCQGTEDCGFAEEFWKGVLVSQWPCAEIVFSLGALFTFGDLLRFCCGEALEVDHAIYYLDMRMFLLDALYDICGLREGQYAEDALSFLDRRVSHDC